MHNDLTTKAVSLAASVGRAQEGMGELHNLLRTARARKFFRKAILGMATAEELRIFTYAENLPNELSRPFELLCNIAARHAKVSNV